jgi:hypothetical protein
MQKIGGCLNLDPGFPHHFKGCADKGLGFQSLDDSDLHIFADERRKKQKGTQKLGTPGAGDLNPAAVKGPALERNGKSPFPGFTLYPELGKGVQEVLVGTLPKGFGMIGDKPHLGQKRCDPQKQSKNRACIAGIQDAGIGGIFSKSLYDAQFILFSYFGSQGAQAIDQGAGVIAFCRAANDALPPGKGADKEIPGGIILGRLSPEHAFQFHARIDPNFHVRFIFSLADKKIVRRFRKIPLNAAQLLSK